MAMCGSGAADMDLARCHLTAIHHCRRRGGEEGRREGENGRENMRERRGETEERKRTGGGEHEALRERRGDRRRGEEG